MVLIGLTGGIASGKSSASRILLELGAKVVDADQAARQVAAKGSPLLEKLAAAFGEDILLEDRSLDRAKLGERIFGDEEKRRRLNELMHPEIKKEIFRRIDVYAKQGEKAVFLDIPLLFETKWHKYTQENWVVYADEKKQLERLMRRNRLSKEQAMARIKSQMPLDEKLLLADVVIDNNGGRESTRRQVEKAWRLLAEKLPR